MPLRTLILCDPLDYTVHGILQARILEWVAVPFSRGSSQPSDGTQVSRIAGGFFTSWATSEALLFTGRCQIIYIKKSLEAVGSNPHGWLGRVQDFNGGSHCRCGRNSKRTRMRSGVLSHFSCVLFFVTPWTIACQAPLSIGFSRQESCSGLPCPPPCHALLHAIPPMEESSWPRDRTLVSHVPCTGRQVLYHYHYLGSLEPEDWTAAISR